MDILVVGGLGHVGLPLSLKLAELGHNVTIHDTSEAARKAFLAGHALFEEPGLDAWIDQRGFQIICGDWTGNFPLRPPHARSTSATFDVIVYATSNLNLQSMLGMMSVSFSQPVLIRQTVRPEDLQPLLDLGYQIAYVPERIAQGKALEELNAIPQIIGANTPQMAHLAAEVFSWVDCHQVSVQEAVLAKLFCNLYRYVQFGLVNEMWMMANLFSADFGAIRRAMQTNYPRMNGLARPGWAAGFCLPKDAKYLEDYSWFADTAYTVNQQGYPGMLASAIDHHLHEGKTVGLLGLTAKADCDDTRGSFLNALEHIDSGILSSEALQGLPKYDPYMHDYMQEEQLHQVLLCDIIIVGVPHTAFEHLAFLPTSTVVNPWNK